MVDHPIKGWSGLLAQQQRHNHEDHRSNNELDDRSDGQGASSGQGNHHGENHNAENVVEHGRADHDLTLTGAQITKFAEDTGRDADARRRHRGAGKDGWNGIDVEDCHQPEGSEQEGQNNPCDGNGKGLDANGHQLFELTFQTGEEQK